MYRKGSLLFIGKLRLFFQLILVLLVFIQFAPYANAQKGTIKGVVREAFSNEPVSFANVIIVRTVVGTTTDLDGNFVFSGVDAGFVRIAVSSVGYEAFTTSELQVDPSGTVFIEIALKESAVSLGEVKVNASVFERRVENPVSLRTIGIAEIEKNPGGNRDISRVIQSYPGVASSVSYRNDLIVRGGGSAENRFYLDDVEIPNLNHFSTQGASGGAVGIINSDFIREVDFYSGGFPANRGNALSSVIVFKQKDGNPDGLRFSGTVGASDLALSADGPAGKNSNFIFSVRRSYLQFLFSAIGLPFLPIYNDYQFKYRWRIDPKNEITIISLGALDQSRLNTSANKTEDQRFILNYLPENEQWNYTFGMVYKHFHENNFNTWVFSRNMLNNVSYKYLNNDEANPKISDYNSDEAENKFRFERTMRLKKQWKLNAGINFDYARYSNSSFQKIILGNEILDQRYFSSLDLFSWGAFAQLSGRMLENRLGFSAGIRSDANSWSDEMNAMQKQISPRLSLSYDISDKLALSFNTGIYYQRPPYTSLGFRNSEGVLVNRENKLRYIESEHIVGGIEFRPGSESQVSFEVFYKHYRHYPFSVSDSIAIASKGADYGTFGDEALLSTATGRAYGLEIWGRARNVLGFNPVFSYTYVRSEFSDIRKNFIPSAWDSKHILSITATRSFKGNWDLGFKWRYAGGAPYTPYNEELSSRTEVWDARGRGYPNYSQFNQLRLKSFHQLDIRVDKEFYMKKWSLTLYLDIQNFYNFKADQPAELTRLEDSNGIPLPAYNDGNQESRYYLKYLKNDSGTIIPTLGIIAHF